MEADHANVIPAGENWQYEPKWDGFRCLLFKDRDELYLQSKSGQPLGRYFPEVLEHCKRISASTAVLDGELAVPVEGRFSFDDLLQRIHPAESRVRKLASQTPAVFIVFDILVDAKGKSLVDQSLKTRRAALEVFAEKHFHHERLRLSPQTRSRPEAEKWFLGVGGDLDGIVAKKLDEPYRSGERRGMLKIKRRRTADCVVGGFRYATNSKLVGSLLLGLYDDAGLLHHVGFCSGLKTAEKPQLTRKLVALREPPGFTGRAPGGPSRWSTERSAEWEPLKPELVLEVSYDHFTGGRFRHGTSLLRWRPDKPPGSCHMDQAEQGGRAALALSAAHS